MNTIMDTDSYKASHWLQYPPNTTEIYSYLESRGGKYQNTVFFGLQYLLEKLETKITMDMIKEAEEFFKVHGEPFNRNGWRHIVEDLGGKLPVRIHAVPEGLVIPVLHPLMTVENTDPQCYWLTSWLETQLMRVWYPITVATQSWHIKQIIRKFLHETTSLGNAEADLKFKLHDFGSRGVSSEESAAIGGAAHLVNFMGSDTVAGVDLMNRVYNDGSMSAFSIPASEHSTMTTWGVTGELDAYENMLRQYGAPGRIFAVVSDSYDLDHAVDKLWGEELRQKVIDSGATLVIRPDSGDPKSVVLRTLQKIDEKFGSTVNSRGFKILRSVKVIQGDGVDEFSIRDVLNAAKDAGFCASNVNFGMGGALLQKLDRDTQRFAYKCSSATINGKIVDVYKDPKTDPMKRSKKGRMDLVRRGVKYETLTGTGHFGSVMKLVFENGLIKKRYTLGEVRSNSEVLP